jgi:hypothetical protein
MPVMDSHVMISMNVMMLIPVLMFQTVPVSIMLVPSRALATRDTLRKMACVKTLTNANSLIAKITLNVSTFQDNTHVSVTLVTSTAVMPLTTLVFAMTLMNVILDSRNAVKIHTA